MNKKDCIEKKEEKIKKIYPDTKNLESLFIDSSIESFNKIDQTKMKKIIKIETQNIKLATIVSCLTTIIISLFLIILILNFVLEGMK